jgi:hypothetical protein
VEKEQLGPLEQRAHRVAEHSIDLRPWGVRAARQADQRIDSLHRVQELEVSPQDLQALEQLLGIDTYAVQEQVIGGPLDDRGPLDRIGAVQVDGGRLGQNAWGVVGGRWPGHLVLALHGARDHPGQRGEHDECAREPEFLAARRFLSPQQLVAPAFRRSAQQQAQRHARDERETDARGLETRLEYSRTLVEHAGKSLRLQRRRDPG